MSENTFEKLAKSVNDLAESIENNADAITDRIRKNKQAQQLANGEITQEEAFAQDVQFFHGEMLSEYCTYCGAPIRMHSKMQNSPCRHCGHSVELSAAKSGRYEKTAIKQMDGALLYSLSQKKRYNRDALLLAAAEKGDANANAELALTYVFKEDYSAARQYAKAGKSKGNADCALCLLACDYCTKAPEDAETALNAVRRIKKDALSEKGKELYNILEKTIIEYWNEQLEAKRAREAAIYSSSSSSSYSSSDSYSSSGSFTSYGTGVLEPTIWSDWRNGEQLYRSPDGKIVNGKGEEVSVAWWD